MAKRTITALSATLFLVGSNVAYGGGPTEHLHILAEATNNVEDLALQQLLQETQQSYYGMGGLFPDTVCFPPLCFCSEICYNPTLDVHGDAFLSTYIELIRGRCGSLPDLNDPECRELVAHFMGSLGHTVGDYRFDRYFLSRVDTLCGFNDGGDSGGSQLFTDLILDTCLSSLNPDIRPTEAAVPGPYQANCVFDYPDCLNVLSVLRTTFPIITDFPAVTFIGVDAAVNANFEVLEAQPELSAVNCLLVLAICPWALENVQQNYGGFQDSGAVLARYINKTWEILQNGNLPRFERSTCWLFPAETLSVYDSDGDRWRFDYASWITMASGVSSFQLSSYGPSEIWRIGVLVDGELLIYEGPFDVSTKLVSVADNVSSFQLEENRIGVLVGTGPPNEGHELLVKEGSVTSGWISVAEGVLDFQLEGDRIAWLEKLGGNSPVTKLKAREGAVGSPTVFLMANKIKQFQLEEREEGDRIGVLLDKSAVPGSPPRRQELLVKEGALDGHQWVSLLEDFGLENFQLEGDRIGLLRDGELLVQDGPLGSSWVSEQFGVSQWLLEGDLIGAVIDGELLIKYGGVWVSKGKDVSSFDLSDNPDLLMSRDVDGVLRRIDLFHNDACLEGLPEKGSIARFELDGIRVGVLLNDTLYVKREWTSLLP